MTRVTHTPWAWLCISKGQGRARTPIEGVADLSVWPSDAVALRLSYISAVIALHTEMLCEPCVMILSTGTGRIALKLLHAEDVGRVGVDLGKEERLPVLPIEHSHVGLGELLRGA